jgi:bisphosphoglycerate-dependent phosphoglycerate mutase
MDPEEISQTKLEHYDCMMNTTRFCLVRHGETDWNVERRLQGHTNICLNRHGVAQAKTWPEPLRQSIFSLMRYTPAI